MPGKEKAFNDMLKSTDWSSVLNEEDCNRKWESFTNTIKTALDATCPEKEVKVKINGRPNHIPWMTEGLSTSKK